MVVKFIKLVLVILLTLLVFLPTLSWMRYRFSEAESFYAHGYLIPFVVAYLIFLKKEQLRNLSPNPSNAGLILLLVSLAVHLFAFYFEINFLSGLFFIAAVCGLVLYNYGAPCLRTLAFPLGFLFFMIPLPNAMTLGLSFYLKILAARMACSVIGIIVPLKNAGSLVYLPNGVLTVGTPCSGLKSLIALSALSLLFAYLTGFSFKRRILFFLAALPVAFISNVVRIILLILVYYVYGAGVAMGWFHDFSGMLVFVFAFLGLALLRKFFMVF
ncbi:MAG: exosortase/archaeosortase family protein [Candidatus Omnitrophica bacterium]|nr:exosortase/archaeosortase family protein [Candidatus Omnitrophota bacterium]MBU4478273.1 exosortase/archaeosortase family protein [Candidatus Omnitrophota bacterium]MCG2703341.1 exosortase/archaeosortase family protein [Candidatus Omnitrophota bacterium]